MTNTCILIVTHKNLCSLETAWKNQLLRLRIFIFCLSVCRAVFANKLLITNLLNNLSFTGQIMSYISLNMNLSFSMFPTFNLSRRNKYPKYVLCFSLTSIWIKHLFAKMNSYIGNLSVESCTRSLAHANMKCSIGKELSIYITPPCATVLKKLRL